MVLNFLRSAVLSLVFATQALSVPAGTEEFTFRIPPQRVSLNIDNQPITIAASGIISVGSRGHDEYILKRQLDADLLEERIPAR